MVDFCCFFMKVCIDQIEYMTSLLQPAELLNRIGVYVAKEVAVKRLPKRSFELIREAVRSGEFERGRGSDITGYGDRQARSVLSALVDRGLHKSDRPKLSVRLEFPLEIVERRFPALYPATTARS